jgi:hypothetical protein
VGAFQRRVNRMASEGERGLLANSGDALPPASEREARMDDPTSRCENDAGLGARLLELLISIRSSFFLCGTELVPAKRID